MTMDRQQLDFSHQPFAWTVPTVLIAGIAAALVLKWPIYCGLMISVLWAALYAMRRFSLLRIYQAAQRGMLGMWRVCLMLVMVGLVVALWMRIGSIPYLMQLASSVIYSGNVVWVSFLAATVLSMIIGSSIATWSVVGPPLVSIVPAQFAPFVAGALVSGAMVGDRSSPMSASVVILSDTSGVPYPETLRRLLRSTALPFSIALALYFIANRTAFTTSRLDMPSSAVIGMSHWSLVIPPLLVLIFALLRVPLLYNLAAAVLIGSVYAVYTTSATPRDLFDSVWYGYVLELHGRVSHVGGILPMLAAVILIAVAGAFQGISTLGGAVDYLAVHLFERANNRLRFLAAVYLLCISFSLLMGSQMLAVIMSGNTLRPHFHRRNLSNTMLLRIVGDAAELTPAVVPWNLLGLQAGVILGVPTLHFLAYAWYIFAAILLSVLQTAVALPRFTRDFAPMHDSLNG